MVNGVLKRRRDARIKFALNHEQSAFVLGIFTERAEAIASAALAASCETSATDEATVLECVVAQDEKGISIVHLRSVPPIQRPHGNN